MQSEKNNTTELSSVDRHVSNLMLLRIIVFLWVLILGACSAKQSSNEMSAAPEYESTESKTSGDKVETHSDRKIIKNGDISFETSNINETKSIVSKSVTQFGGYISKDNVYNSTGRVSHRLVIRIPADKFDALLIKISESVSKLDHKNIELKDVTEEYIDVETRIKTKKELEQKYRELLGEAKTVTDILAIEKEIGVLRSDIESIEGRLKYLKDRIGFSTLTVQYYQKISSSFGFAAKFSRALVTGWSWLLSFLIGLTHLWPFVLLLSGGIFILIRYKRRRK